MKRKSRILLCMLLSLVLLFTGCNKGNEGEQNPNQEPTTETVDMSPYLKVTDKVEYDIDTQVTLEDVLTIDETVSGNVTQSVMLDETGAPVSVLNTTQAGTFKVTIISEFIDGSTGTVEYTYNVIDPIMPNEYLDNFMGATSVYEGNGFSFANKDIEVISMAGSGLYDNDGRELQGIAQINSITPSQLMYTDKMSEQDVLKFIKETEALVSTTNDVLMMTRTSANVEQHLVLVDDSAFSLMSGENEGKIEAFYNSMVDVYSQIVQDSNIPDIKIYDTITKSDIVLKSYKVMFDFSLYNPELSWTQISNVWVGSYNGTVYVVLNSNMNIFENMDNLFNRVLADGEDIYKITEDIFSYDKYGSFMTQLYGTQNPYTVENITAAETTCIEDYTSIPYALKNKIIYGSWSSLVPKEESSTEQSPVDESTEGTSTEETIIEDTSKEGNYKNEHPEIYTMFKDNETRFYRWMFDLANASYAGSVYKPDGTLLPKEDVEKGANYDSMTGQSSQGSSSYSREAYTLSTSYNSYTLDDVAKPEMIFNTANSSSSRLVVQYNDLKYYIEATKSTKVAAYKTNCLYSTASFKNTEFSVIEDQIYTLGDWKATKYNISYTNTSGDKITRPYMVVLTTDTDYIVCYADDLVDVNDTDILYNILTWCMNTEIEDNIN